MLRLTNSQSEANQQPGEQSEQAGVAGSPPPTADQQQHQLFQQFLSSMNSAENGGGFANVSPEQQLEMFRTFMQFQNAFVQSSPSDPQKLENQGRQGQFASSQHGPGSVPPSQPPPSSQSSEGSAGGPSPHRASGNGHPHQQQPPHPNQYQANNFHSQHPNHGYNGHSAFAHHPHPPYHQMQSPHGQAAGGFGGEASLFEQSDNADTILFVIVLITGIFFVSKQFMGNIKSHQDKRYQKLKKEMQNQLSTPGSQMSDRGTSASLNGYDATCGESRSKIQNFLLDSDFDSSDYLDNDVSKKDGCTPFELAQRGKGLQRKDSASKSGLHPQELEEEQSVRSDSERGQFDQELSKHQLTKMIEEKLKSEQNSACRRKETGYQTNQARNDGSTEQKMAEPIAAKRTSSYISRGSSQNGRMQDTTLDHPKAMKKSKHPIIRICLTGGPCAGKTTALATLNQVLTQLGFKVLQVPEAATMLMKGGAMIQTHKLKLQDAVRFQINVMRTQMVLEDIFVKIAINSDQKTVIICDRGVMDGSAYTDENVWQALLDETGWNTIQLRDRRYEAVIHMVTCADGAEQFYTDENNQARYESKEHAIALDKKLVNAWVGHPHFSIIDNKGQGFQQKVDKCVESVCRYIGLPTPTSFYKKFLLRVSGHFEVQAPKKVKMEYFQIEEAFLIVGDMMENFLRKTGKNDSFTYSHEMRSYQCEERIEKRRQISAREYIELFEQSRCPKKKILKKVRQCFIYEQQYFLVETFLNVDGQPSLLRIETTKEHKELEIPSFLDVIREVTHDKSYVGSKMAENDYKMPQADKKAVREKQQAADK